MSARTGNGWSEDERFAEIEASAAEIRDQAAALQRAVESQEARLVAIEAAQARAGRFSPATGPSAPGEALWEMATTGTDIELVPVIAGVRLN